VKRQQAALIAPLLDNANVPIELVASIAGPGNKWNLPLRVEYYALSPTAEQAQDIALQLAKTLKSQFRTKWGFSLSTPMLRAMQQKPTSKKAKKQEEVPIVQNTTMDWSNNAKELDAMFDKQSDEQLKNLAPLEMPSQLQNIDLFQHQRTGIQWLVHQESEKAHKSPFFKQVKENGAIKWLCDITQSSQADPPKAIRGGILADGKSKFCALQ
jgi:hypothetical protein